jgi:acyl CoA:acetate/3-ketoacid CoA transferase beta subunit
LGVLKPDPATRELVLTSVHHGVDPGDVISSTGWPLRVSDDLATTAIPSVLELAALDQLTAVTR